jgi:hypothetical protein
MNLTIDLAIYFILFIVSLISLHSLGAYIRISFFNNSILKKEGVQEFFTKNCLTGFLVIAGLTAVISTKAYTGQTILIFLLVLWIIMNRSKNMEQKTNNFFLGYNPYLFTSKFRILLFINCIIAFAMLISVYTFNNENYYFIPESDFMFYAKLSSSLLETGYEHTGSIGSSFFTREGMNLYHYTDIWFNGFLNLVTGLSEIMLLVLVVYPILLITAIYSVASVFKSKPLLNSIVFAYLLIYGATGFLWYFSSAMSRTFDFIYIFSSRYIGLPGLMYNSTKTLIIIPLILFGFNYIKQKDYFQAYIFFTIAGIAYNTIIPGFIGGIAVLSTYMFFHALINRNNELLRKIFFATLIPLICFITLYLMSKFSGGERNIIIGTSSNIISIKTYIILFIEIIIKSFLVSWLLVLLLLASIKYKDIFKSNLPLIIFSISALIFATIFRLYIYETPNAGQATRNLMPALFTVLTVFLFNELQKIEKIKIINGVLVFIMLFFISHNIVLSNTRATGRTSLVGNANHTMEFMKEVNSIISNQQKTPLYVILSETEYTVLGLNYTNASFILHNSNTKVPLELNFIKNGIKNCKELSGNRILCEYIYKNSYNNSEQAIISYLERKNVLFLYVTGQMSLPYFLNNNVELLIKDANTGDSFYKLIYNNQSLN